MMPCKRKRGESVLAAEQSGKQIPTPQPMPALQPPRDICSTLGHTATVPAEAVSPAIGNCPRTHAVWKATCDQEEVAMGNGNPSARATELGNLGKAGQPCPVQLPFQARPLATE